MNLRDVQPGFLSHLAFQQDSVIPGKLVIIAVLMAARFPSESPLCSGSQSWERGRVALMKREQTKGEGDILQSKFSP